MSEFTIMRMNDCNRMVSDAVRGSKKWFVFWFFAAFLMFFNLDMMKIQESEIPILAASQALLNGENGAETVSMTPFLCQITAFLARLSHAREAHPQINAFAVRLPVCLCALWLIGCAVGLLKQIKGDQTALLGGWLLLLSCPLWFACRTAGTQVVQCAMILAAVRWYWKNQENPDWWAQFVFWAVCGMAMMTGGLSMLFAAPVLAGIHIKLNSAGFRYRKKLSVFMGLQGLFLVPAMEILIYIFCHHGQGLQWSHVSRFMFPGEISSQSMIIYVPAAMLFLVFIYALWRKRGKFLSAGVNEVWLFFSYLWVLFLNTVFHFSFEFIPLLAVFFVMILTLFLSKPKEKNILFPFADGMIRFLNRMIPVSGFFMLISPLLYVWFVKRFLSQAPENWITAMFYFFLPLFGVISLLFFFISVYREKKRSTVFRFSDLYPSLNRLIPFYFAIVFILMILVLPKCM